MHSRVLLTRSSVRSVISDARNSTFIAVNLFYSYYTYRADMLLTINACVCVFMPKCVCLFFFMCLERQENTQDHWMPSIYKKTVLTQSGLTQGLTIPQFQANFSRILNSMSCYK